MGLTAGVWFGWYLGVVPLSVAIGWATRRTGALMVAVPVHSWVGAAYEARNSHMRIVLGVGRRRGSPPELLDKRLLLGRSGAQKKFAGVTGRKDTERRCSALMTTATDAIHHAPDAVHAIDTSIRNLSNNTHRI